VAADLGTAVDRVARQRQQDGSRFVGPAQVAKAEPTSGGYALDAAGTLELAAAPALAPYDPLLEPLQERAAALRERLDRWG
jgi:hypothetical protein